jgi:hypothetical protein
LKDWFDVEQRNQHTLAEQSCEFMTEVDGDLDGMPEN